MFRIERMDVAGRDVTRYLRLLLRKEGADFHRSAEFEIVREIKERLCYVAANAAKEESSENEKVSSYLISYITAFLFQFIECLCQTTR